MIAEHLINLEISNFNLPMLHIINISPENTQKIIYKIIQHTHFFLKNTPVVINVAKLTHKSNWHQLYQAILNSKLQIIGVCSCNDIQLKKIILNSGLPILTENKYIKHHNNQNLINTQEKKQKTKNISHTQLINQPIRSGQQVYARNSDLIIINNISPGAEIIADGHIHIYGTARGRILAGASGNHKCQIFCTHFSPELVSIAGHYWIGDQIPKKFIGKPVRLNLKNNILIIHSL